MAGDQHTSSSRARAARAGSAGRAVPARRRRGGRARRAKTLGKTDAHAGALVPDRRPCEAVGSVTGFQMIADGDRAPFKARENGWIVAWAIDLSKPEQVAARLLRRLLPVEQFGTTPTARISVLKRKDERNYKLKAQSPVVTLGSVLGTQPDVHAHRPAEDPQGRVPGADDPDLGAVLRGQPERRQQRLALEPGRRQVLGHGEHQGRQAAAEGRLGPLLRLRLQDRARSSTGATTPRAERWRRTAGAPEQSSVAYARADGRR